MRVRYSHGSLSTRKNKTGRRFYIGNFRYQANGTWKTKQVILHDESGERITADKAMTRNKTAASDALDRARASLGTVIMDSTATVPEYVMDCIESRRGSIADSTIRGYRDYRHVFERGLSDVPMRNLTVKQVRTWVHGLIECGLAPNTIRKAFNILDGVCDIAVENEDIKANPCTRGIRKDLPKVPTPVSNALDGAGIRRVNGLLDSCKNPRLRIGARLALHCGLRAGEVCGLRWDDVHLGGGVLHVGDSIGDRGATRKEGEAATYVKTPKSKAGTRDVPMTETLAGELAEWRAAQHSEWLTLKPGIPFKKTFVLGYADGSWYSPRSLEHAWANLARGRHARDPEDRRRYTDEWEPGHEPIIGVTGEVVTFHGLRHSYVTVGIEANVDVKTVSSLAGHAQASMTLDRYAAAVPDAIMAAGQTMAPLLEAGTERMRLKAV